MTKIIDIKSLLIGFLLATSVMLFMGAKEEPMEMFVTSSDNGKYQLEMNVVGKTGAFKNYYLLDTYSGELYEGIKRPKKDLYWEKITRDENWIVR